MIIYNVTTKLEWSIAGAWVVWMRQEHIPQVMATQKFIRYQFVKLLDVDEADGPTYAVQYFAAKRAEYDSYIDTYATGFRKEIINKWGENFISFRTLMEEVF